MTNFKTITVSIQVGDVVFEAVAERNQFTPWKIYSPDFSGFFEGSVASAYDHLEQIIKDQDQEALVQSLMAHGRLKVTDDKDAPLEAGQTHILFKKFDGDIGVLIEKRKSLF